MLQFYRSLGYARGELWFYQWLRVILGHVWKLWLSSHYISYEAARLGSVLFFLLCILKVPSAGGYLRRDSWPRYHRVGRDRLQFSCNVTINVISSLEALSISL